MGSQANSGYLKQGALTGVAVVVMNGGNFLIHASASRILGVAGYAVFYAMISLVLIGVSAGNVGGNVITKIVARYIAQNNEEMLRLFTGRVIVYSCIVALVVCLLLVALTFPIAEFLQTLPVVVVPLTAIIISLQLILIAGRAYLQGMHDFTALALSIGTEGILRVILCIALVFHYGIAGILFGYIVSSVVGILYIAFRVLGTRPIFFNVFEKYSFGFAQTAKGIAVVMSVLALMSWSDGLLAKHFFQAYDAGVYSAIALLGRIVLFGTSVVPMIVLPRAVLAVVRGQSLRRELAQACLVTVVLAAVLVSITAAVPGSLTLVLGAAYAAGQPYMLTYSIAMALLSVATTVAFFRIGIGSFEFIPWAIASVVFEIVGISVFHSSISEIVAIVLIANVLNVAAVFVQINFNTPSSSYVSDTSSAVAFLAIEHAEGV